jgi:Spy/CpxP family protein refolding chaperone
MKSAYELAMERLAKSDPSGSIPLTAEQKSRLAEIDRVYKGKLAEREIFLKKQLDEAFAAEKFDDAEKIKQQLASERARIDEERETEKERIRTEKK